MGKRTGLLAGLLVAALGSGVVAQSPSSPPWFGGRVEMPGHGFAWTLPDGWVGFDPSADIADTLARLLYVTGEHESAMDLERFAAEGANEIDAAFFNEGLKRMEAGQDLGDRPAFDGYPGERIEQLASGSRSII